jgi:superfamily II DNA or RNA helicase
MSWPVEYNPHIDLHVKGRIGASDAQRQSETVREILSRFATQPGLVLADEVGMGKTFVALSVAAMVARADRRSRPVVVMVPPSLKEKWPRDFEVFKERCLTRAMARALRGKAAIDAVSFFRMLDDPNEERPHIIFLSHGALHNALSDPWVKFAILKRALSAPRLEVQRKTFPRFAADILRVGSKVSNERFFEEMLRAPTHKWRAVMQSYSMDPGDDPVPEVIHNVLRSEEIRFRALRDALEQMPLRGGENVGERLQAMRQALAQELKELWVQALKAVDFESPLLVLDEAHHVKNPATRLASLFVNAEGDSDAQMLDGALANRFERMLFLTATPFQLGHGELLHVLDRFRGVDWKNDTLALAQADFSQSLVALRRKLDAAQLAATDLDTKWGLIQHEHLAGDAEDPMVVESWWRNVAERPSEQPERVQIVWRAYEATRRAMREANEALRPWVIRHTRPRALGQTGELRRTLWTGASIASGDLSDRAGLPIRDESVLPFMLATRCQTIVARLGEQSAEVAGRITFAEGLASSYEAFLETRALAARRKQQDSVVDEDLVEDDAPIPRGRRLDWYFAQLQRALPVGSAFADHPKIQPTVARVLDLWDAGEKVLLFCHYRRTGKALEQHLSTALQRRLLDRAMSIMRCSAGEAELQLEKLGDRFKVDRPLHRQLKREVETLLQDMATLSREEREHIFEVVLRFVRTPSFLVRHFDLAQTGDAGLLERALVQVDASGLSLRKKIRSFAGFIVERCTADERADYLDALDSIVTGSRRGLDGDQSGNERLPNIRLVNGATGTDERRRLMLAFNAPFFPEILVASSVIAEGVDLHLECRHIIHHDLCWNPSTLEQRTGRVDRIGAKAEQVLRPIQVFLPFVAGTQDEKMFRVVRDRERWFQVVMGGDYQVDEATTDRLAARIPLPDVAARELALRLEVVG